LPKFRNNADGILLRVEDVRKWDGVILVWYHIAIYNVDDQFSIAPSETSFSFPG
jgi:hypothetical protein